MNWSPIPQRSIYILPGGLPKAMTCHKYINTYMCEGGELEKIGFAAKPGTRNGFENKTLFIENTGPGI